MIVIATCKCGGGDVGAFYNAGEGKRAGAEGVIDNCCVVGRRPINNEMMVIYFDTIMYYFEKTI